MKVVERPELRELNSFGLPARARLMVDIETEEDLLAAPGFDTASDLLLGGGSNVVLASDVPGTVFRNRIAGRVIQERDERQALVEAGAGEPWHEFVCWTLDQGLSGLENLSLIPGLVGAAPIQNIGAYGMELSEVLEFVTAWDWRRSTWRTFSAGDCHFGYRDSRFKSEPDRFLITSIGLRLARQFSPRLDYPDLGAELQSAGIETPTAQQVSDAVVAVRRRKLPDPAVEGNAGSFFKNPVVPLRQASTLQETYPELGGWPQEGDFTKLSAGWMIEYCGLKGARIGGAAVSRQHALVLVNRGNATGNDILRLARRVREAVKSEFGVDLEIEPRVIRFPPDH